MQIWIQREGERGCAADGVGCRSVGGVGCWWCADGRGVSMVVVSCLSVRPVDVTQQGGVVHPKCATRVGVGRYYKPNIHT